MPYCTMPSPLGDLWLREENGALTHIGLPGTPPPVDVPQEETPLLREAQRQLNEYFAGKRRDLSLPLKPAGTPFRRRVWAVLQTIPYGKTVTYGDLAKTLGAPGAARAVGGACHCNPLPIVIPCHRVIGAGGVPVGYAGGIGMKERLLKLEAT